MSAVPDVVSAVTKRHGSSACASRVRVRPVLAPLHVRAASPVLPARLPVLQRWRDAVQSIREDEMIPSVGH